VRRRRVVAAVAVILTAVALVVAFESGSSGHGARSAPKARAAAPTPRAAAPRHAARPAPAAPATAAAGAPRVDPLAVRPQLQHYRNDCEATALSMLLTAAGAPRTQEQVMGELPRDGPADPRILEDGTWVWGDPERGFVGRVKGGGIAGGYGVFVGPVLALARRHVPAEDLTRRPLAVIIDHLRRHRPVMVWVGLSDGPYQRWVTPRGRQVVGNFGEHSLLLVAFRRGEFVYNDPLTGARDTVSPEGFTTMWARLGRRAISA
jgi:uncharacterized protein YvpB